MIPSILLIGCGKFGKNHLRVLKELENEHAITFEGAVVKTEKTRSELERDGIRAYTDLEKALVNADAVDIVTPSSTHAEIAAKCLKTAHCLVEKPLAMSQDEIRALDRIAKESSRVLMVGQIYRFNQALKKIRQMGKPRRILIRLVGGGEMPDDAGALHTFNHAFDILDMIFQSEPINIRCVNLKKKKGLEEYVRLEMEFPEGSASVEIGWMGNMKERSVTLEYGKETVHCDLVKQTIKIDGKETAVKHDEPLKEELKAFISAIKGKRGYPDSRLALRIEKIIERSRREMD
jgi:predicted dehydrogenase